MMTVVEAKQKENGTGDVDGRVTKNGRVLCGCVSGKSVPVLRPVDQNIKNEMEEREQKRNCFILSPSSGCVLRPEGLFFRRLFIRFEDDF